MEMCGVSEVWANISLLPNQFLFKDKGVRIWNSDSQLHVPLDSSVVNVGNKTIPFVIVFVEDLSSTFVCHPQNCIFTIFLNSNF